MYLSFFFFSFFFLSLLPPPGLELPVRDGV